MQVQDTKAFGILLKQLAVNRSKKNGTAATNKTFIALIIYKTISLP